MVQSLIDGSVSPSCGDVSASTDASSAERLLGEAHCRVTVTIVRTATHDHLLLLGQLGWRNVVAGGDKLLVSFTAGV